MSIPQSFLQTLLSRSDIVDVIGSRIPLKKKGTSYFACCPFHQEKSASFHVSPNKQFYYCFGCGAHGNVITFVREYDGLDFVEAIESLAQSLGLTVPYESLQEEKRLRSEAEPTLLYDMLEKASRFYQWQLRQHEAAKEVIDYLKKRQVSGETAKKFALGFAPEGWDALLKQIGKTSVEISALMAAGLVVQNDQNRRYDRFRHRLMFPIRDRKGRTVGFGGRVLVADEEPKYLNSPETEIFHKGALLYGLYELKQQRIAEDFIIIVEGYMDVVMLSQCGILNAVATLGTAVTSEHMKQLFRHSDHLVFCFDGDHAGREAARRAIKVLLPFMHSGHRSARFLFLPERDDPDSYIKAHGQKYFLEQVQFAKPFLDFVWDMVSEGLNLKALNDRAQCVERGLGFCRLLPEGVYRSMLLQQLAEGSRWALDQIMVAFNKIGEKEEKNIIKREQIGAQTIVDPLLTRAICTLCNYPIFSHQLDHFELCLVSEESRLFQELLKVCRQFEVPTFPLILEAIDQTYWRRLVEIADQDLHVEVTQEGFLELCHKLQQREIDSQLKALIEKSKTGDLNSQEKIFLREALSKKKLSKSTR